MNKCTNCIHKKCALFGKKKYICEVKPKKRFERSELHGWLCMKYLDNSGRVTDERN